MLVGLDIIDLKIIFPLFCGELYGYVGNSLLIIVKIILLVYWYFFVLWTQK